MDEARTFSADQRKKLAEQGKALPDGSYPIVTKGDLRNAIQAYGRASNKAAARRHIIKRARALGATDLLPDGWDSASSLRTPATVTRKTMQGTARTGTSRTKERTIMSDTAEGIVTKPHKFSPQPDKKSVCASCNKTRDAGPHASDRASELAAESFTDTMSLLRRSVREEVGRRSYLVDASAEWLVYERYDEDMGEYRLYRRSYSMSDGSVSLDDDAVEVLRTTVYVPASKQESAAGLIGIWGASLATDYANALGQTRNFNSTKGTPKSDLDHPFTQDEGSHSIWCSTCGRNRRNPVHGGDQSSTPLPPTTTEDAV